MWWNLHNFAHYDASQSSATRWPTSQADYEAKRDRVLVAFQEMFGKDYPDLIAVCEITRIAASDLANRLPTGFSVTFSQDYPRDDGFQVAVFYRSGVGLSAELPLLPTELEDVAEGTRPMVPVHLTMPGHLIRFVACHWTAFDEGRVARERLADIVRRDTFHFLHPTRVRMVDRTRHIVILGDLNEEPMSPVFEQRLIGRRDRESSRSDHWRDEQVRRIRLYNAAWRYVGEQVSHGATGQSTIGAAGTYFTDPHNWRTLDHILVSGGLLGATPPYFDEAQTRIVATPIMVDEHGLPRPFQIGATRGVSDHLPIVGRIVLPETTK